MFNRLVVLCAIAALLTACGGRSTDTVTVTTEAAPTTTNIVSPAPMTVTVYELAAGSLFPRTVRVPHTQAVARAALGALGVGANVTVVELLLLPHEATRAARTQRRRSRLIIASQFGRVV